MSMLRQILLGIALIAAVCGLIWQQQARIESIRADLTTAGEQLAAAKQNIEQHRLAIAAKTDELEQERAAQIGLRKQEQQLRQQLLTRHRQIEDLKHENEELRDWAGVSLPDVARGLRQRPTITGAADYQDWLSGSNALHPDGDGADHQRGSAAGE